MRQGLRVQPAMRGQKRVEDALCPAMTTRVTCSRQTQNLGGGARRGAASRRCGMGIKPSRWASFLAALRARRMASAFSRVFRSDGFSYALPRFISRKTPSPFIFYLSSRRGCSRLLSRRSTCKMFPIVLLALRCAPLMQRSTRFEILRRLLAAVADHFVFDRLTLVESGQAGALDRGNMDEHIFAAA